MFFSKNKQTVNLIKSTTKMFSSTMDRTIDVYFICALKSINFT